MTIEEFWNRAFIAALCRLPPRQAKVEADEATQLCIEQWQTFLDSSSRAPEPPRWQDQPIGRVPMRGEDYRAMKRAGIEPGAFITTSTEPNPGCAPA